MADSVTGVPVFTTGQLTVADYGANGVGEAVDGESFTLTTPGTNASLVSVSNQKVTAFVTSGSGVGGTVLVDLGVSGEVTAASFIGGSGYVATDTITVSEVAGDAMDTNAVLTIDAVQGNVRDRWNQRAVVAVSDHPADGGDAADRAYFVSEYLNGPWRLGGAKLGTATTNDTAGAVDGQDIVIPE
jgi:hypothetical protein